MRYPEFLKEGGSIGFVAPSFGCVTEPYRSCFAEALKRFGALGHTVVKGPNVFSDCGTGISNTPYLCGRELNEAYVSANQDVLISCGGGELMCEVVPFIDFEAIKAAPPKWFMGFSDNTNFTFLSATLADTAAIYGPCAAAFGMRRWHPAIEDAYRLLRGEKLEITGYDMWERESLKSEEDPLAEYNLTEKSRMVYYPEYLGELSVRIKGRLIGGCLDCLSVLAGTVFDRTADFAERYAEDGIIWFLEACDLNPMSIRRALWQLKNAGWFQNVRAFLIGRPMHFGEEVLGVNQYNAVTEILGEYDVPVIMDMDIGHLPPMMPIICGAKAQISFKGNTVRTEYEIR